ncbi:helix-turn-helix transcriptional regulator [Leptothermofonsia sp. ETS-13]|uniref:helix-turn-helix transcriptional regulator n=1 Tax=Leptothermofonsia sp. ETS-13 TaxID=3035696 RepID=UPI003B9F5EEF
MSTSTNTPNASQKHLDDLLVEGVLEGFIDGFMILTERGEIVHANSPARHMLQQINQDEMHPYRMHREIQRMCKATIASQELYLNRTIVIESEVAVNQIGMIRIRAQWLKLDAFKEPLVLVTLEDQRRSAYQLAIAEGQQYGLTPREAEIWRLRRANYSYKQIAAELFITLNTVKKHLKSIHSKRRCFA